MQLQYSSQNFSFKLGKHPHCIAKNATGYYITTDESKKCFSDFLFLSHFGDYYLVTISEKEFVMYKVETELEQVIKISSINPNNKNKLFNYIILNADADFIKITNDLKLYHLDFTDTSKKALSFYNKKFIEIPECELYVYCNNNMLSSITTDIFYPYDGNISTTFCFTH